MATMILEGEIVADEESQGENYFVSMTDMMVGMLFVFIILLMSFALSFRQQTDKQEGKIQVAEDVGRELDDLETRISRRLSEIREANQLRLRLLHELEAELRREKLLVEIVEANGVLRLTEDAVRFQSEDATLVGRWKENVGKIARVLARVLPNYAACSKVQRSLTCIDQKQSSVETMFIEGHTDVTGLDEENWILSAQRAANTYRELTAISPELRRLFNRRGEEILSISGYSSTRPIDAESNSNAWAKNRRIDLRFVMDTDSTANLEEINGLLQRMRKAIQDLKGSS
jgi:chemotaxis protein MotB